MKYRVVKNWNAVPVVVDIAFVAKLLRFSEVHVRRLCMSGEIKAQKIGKFWRIGKSELMRLCGEVDDEETA